MDSLLGRNQKLATKHMGKQLCSVNLYFMRIYVVFLELVETLHIYTSRFGFIVCINFDKTLKHDIQ